MEVFCLGTETSLRISSCSTRRRLRAPTMEQTFGCHAYVIRPETDRRPSAALLQLWLGAHHRPGGPLNGQNNNLSEIEVAGSEGLTASEQHQVGGRRTHGWGGARDSPRSAPRSVSCGYSGSRNSGFSTSSMFTSLKVITRTCLTNRAGRYMSHTQASASRSSK